MTPEQLLHLPRPISELTDEQLIAHFTPFFPNTRPVATKNYILMQATASTAQSTSDVLTSLEKAYIAAGMDRYGNPIQKEVKRVSLRNLT